MSRKLLTLAALATVFVLPLSVANAKDRASDFGDDVNAFFSGAARGVGHAANKVEDGAKDTFSFFKDKAEEADDKIDRNVHAPWEK
jgi:hypothetical protein